MSKEVEGESGSESDEIEGKAIRTRSEIPLDCLEIIVEFIGNIRILNKILRLSKSVLRRFCVEHPRCCINVQFRLRQPELLTERIPYVISLDVFQENLPCNLLKFFPNLEILSFMGCAITGGKTLLSVQKKLKVLSLNITPHKWRKDNRFNEFFKKDVAKNLENVSVYNYLGLETESFIHMKEIRILSITKCDNISDIFKEKKLKDTFSNLTFLELVALKGIREICGLKNLRSLLLYFCQSLTTIRHCTSLSFLRVCYCNRLEDIGKKNAVEKLEVQGCFSNFPIFSKYLYLLKQLKLTKTLIKVDYFKPFVKLETLYLEKVDIPSHLVFLNLSSVKDLFFDDISMRKTVVPSFDTTVFSKMLSLKRITYRDNYKLPVCLKEIFKEKSEDYEAISKEYFRKF